MAIIIFVLLVLLFIILIKSKKEEDSNYCWGYNFYGQLGIGNETNSHFIPVKFNIQESKIIFFSCGSYHSIALTGKFNSQKNAYFNILDTDQLFSWGWNSSGQLGTGDLINRTKPIKLHSSFLNQPILSLSCGSSLSALITGEFHFSSILNLFI